MTRNGNAALARGVGKHLHQQHQQIPEQILTDLTDSIKAKLLAGESFSLINLPNEERAEAIGAIAKLRDEYPVRCRWTTIRESHLSETRLRARSYSIPGEFLRGEVTP